MNEMELKQCDKVGTDPQPGHATGGDTLIDLGAIAGTVGMLVVAQDARTLFAGDVVFQMNVGEVTSIRYGGHFPLGSDRIRSFKS